MYLLSVISNCITSTKDLKQFVNKSTHISFMYGRLRHIMFQLLHAIFIYVSFLSSGKQFS